MEKNKQLINGLVLAGGKSVRMGIDKSSIQWHGMDQSVYMADLLKPFCSSVFISRRPGQSGQTTGNYKTLVDILTGRGPFGAILSAFQFQPDVAWLVVACDLPLIEEKTLAFLIANRDEEAMATTFQSPYDGLPEPLITIWEPKSYSVMLSCLSAGYSCPRKVLIKSNDVRILTPPDADALMNVNTPEDLEKATVLISQKKYMHGAG